MKLIDRMLREYIPTVMRGDVSVPTNPTTDNVVCQLRINSPLILHPNAPVSFYFPSLHSSASPPSRHPRPPLFKKKDQKKKSLPNSHSTLLLSILHPTLLTLPFALLSSPQVQFTSDSCQRPISSHPHNSPPPLSWEITPLRSILTRSLTGYSKVRFSS